MVDGEHQKFSCTYYSLVSLLPVHYTIYSDAILEGWGVADGETDIEGRWGENEKISHTDSLELVAAFLCLKSFCKKQIRYSRTLEIG